MLRRLQIFYDDVYNYFIYRKWAIDELREIKNKRWLASSDMAAVIAKFYKKPVLYLNTGTEDVEEIQKAAPYLTSDQALILMCNGEMIVVCKNIQELDKFFDMTVGDEGSTELNKYNGPGNVYALTFYKNGLSGTENT